MSVLSGDLTKHPDQDEAAKAAAHAAGTLDGMYWALGIVDALPKHAKDDGIEMAKDAISDAISALATQPPKTYAAGVAEGMERAALIAEGKSRVTTWDDEFLGRGSGRSLIDPRKVAAAIRAAIPKVEGKT